MRPPAEGRLSGPRDGEGCHLPNFEGQVMGLPAEGRKEKFSFTPLTFGAEI